MERREFVSEREDSLADIFPNGQRRNSTPMPLCLTDQVYAHSVRNAPARHDTRNTAANCDCCRRYGRAKMAHAHRAARTTIQQCVEMVQPMLCAMFAMLVIARGTENSTKGPKLVDRFGLLGDQSRLKRRRLSTASASQACPRGRQMFIHCFHPHPSFPRGVARIPRLRPNSVDSS